MDKTAEVPVDESTAVPPAGEPMGGDKEIKEAIEETSESQTSSPEYMQVFDEGIKNNDSSLKRFYDVEVTISAELGRVSIPIGDVVKLGEGSVIDLERPISSPVEVMAQGVRIATGEVVVIDDCFAIRIKNIDSNIAEK